MFSAIKKSIKIGKLRANTQMCVQTLQKIHQTVTVLGQPTLADNLLDEGLGHFNEQYQTQLMWSRHPHMVSAEDIDQLLNMQTEMKSRLELQLEMIKAQGLAYFDSLEKAEGVA